MFVKTPTFDNNEITLSAFRSCQNVIFVGNIIKTIKKQRYTTSKHVPY